MAFRMGSWLKSWLGHWFVDEGTGVLGVKLILKAGVKLILKESLPQVLD